MMPCAASFRGFFHNSLNRSLRAHFAGSAMTQRSKLLGFGNPLLDMILYDCPDLMVKFNLPLDDQLLADSRTRPLFKDVLSRSKTPLLRPGGATQNSIRTAQWLLQEPEATAFVGAVGDDAEGKLLQEAAKSAGVKAVYQIREQEKTGVCVCLINGEGRCLVTELNAALNFDADIHRTISINSALSEAKLIYVGGYMWSSSPRTVVNVARYANEHGVPLAMNLHAPYLCSFYVAPEFDILPRIDILFGNGREALRFAHCLAHSELPCATQFERFLEVEEAEPEPELVLAIAKEVASLPKRANCVNGRKVIFTNGRAPLAFCDTSGPLQAGLVPILPLSPKEVKDTNGCGDAFVGGFLAQMLRGEKLQTAIQCGFYASRHVAMAFGCSLSGDPDFQDSSR